MQKSVTVVSTPTRLITALLLLSIPCSCHYNYTVKRVKRVSKKQVWEIFVVQDEELMKVLRTKFTANERQITLEDNRLSFHIVNSYWATYTPGKGSRGFVHTLVAAVDQRLNRLETYIANIMQNNLKRFFSGAYDDHLVSLSGPNGELMFITPLVDAPAKNDWKESNSETSVSHRHDSVPQVSTERGSYRHPLIGTTNRESTLRPTGGMSKSERAILPARKKHSCKVNSKKRTQSSIIHDSTPVIPNFKTEKGYVKRTKKVVYQKSAKIAVSEEGEFVPF